MESYFQIELRKQENDTNRVPPNSCRRGTVYYADLSPVIGSEQGGTRPVLVIQNNIGNLHSPTVIVAAITTSFPKARMLTHIELKASEVGLEKDSVIMLEQIRTIDKKRLRKKVACLNSYTMRQVDYALRISVGLPYRDR